MLAANYLEIKFLLLVIYNEFSEHSECIEAINRDLGCKYVVNLIRGLTPKEIRDILHIENDWEASEYKQILAENVIMSQLHC